MKRTGRKKEWTILVFCLFMLGISPPIIIVFDRPLMVFDFPLSFLYLYGFWGLMIVLIAIGARKRKSFGQDATSLQDNNPSGVNDAQ